MPRNVRVDFKAQGGKPSLRWWKGKLKLAFANKLRLIFPACQRAKPLLGLNKSGANE